MEAMHCELFQVRILLRGRSFNDIVAAGRGCVVKRPHRRDRTQARASVMEWPDVFHVVPLYTVARRERVGSDTIHPRDGAGSQKVYL